MKTLFGHKGTDGGKRKVDLQPLTSDLWPLISGRRNGFTLVELLGVILIISILAAAMIGLYQQARNAAWKEKARDSAHQIAIAWNIRLMDDHKFPDTIVSIPQPFQTTAANMAILNSNIYNRIYLEQSAEQRINDNNHGMKDKWGNFFYVQLDTTYGGAIKDPRDSSATINANVVVWSTGPHPSDKANSYCVASP
jgi:prepilin-type N-terminal cleavage/methylation domain-containing protein